MRLLLEIVFIALAFALGHWTALHPADTRSFIERIQGAIGRLIHRNP